MLVLLANHHDRSARRIVERWAPFGAGMITCNDLSAPGWRFSPGAPAASTVVVDGKIVSSMDITGVLTRRPCVVGQELVHIRHEDREYVAAEMNAFLTAWLSSLSCPVLNRPTAACLSGPNWRPEEWARAAVSVGIPVMPIRRRVFRSHSDGDDDRTHTPESGVLPDPGATGVTVVGDRCFGAVESCVAAQARHLARAAGVDFLQVRFSGSKVGAHFLSVNLIPDIDHPDVAEAVLEYLRRRPGARLVLTR